MAQITSNQHSYSNASALLNVTAIATRTNTSNISITADWTIYTAGSSYSGATRYLVLFVGSTSGTKYYSTAIGTNWSSQTTYSGLCTFTDIPLAADQTEITIGFGVSGSNSSLSTSGTLIWNGSSEVSSSTYDPNIQFNKITGISQGYTKCGAPTTFTVSPTICERNITLSWSGAQDGINNFISRYEIQYATSTDGVSWGSWSIFEIVVESPLSANINNYSIYRGNYVKFRIRTLGSAGYDSDWKDSNSIRKNSLPTTPTNPQISKIKCAPSEVITVSWSSSTDVDGNLNGYRLVRSPIEGEAGDVSLDGYINVSMLNNTSRNVTVPSVPGQSVRFAVRAEDNLGAISDWLNIGAVDIIYFVKIFNGMSWDSYIPYINNNGDISIYEPHYYDNNSWT